MSSGMSMSQIVQFSLNWPQTGSI